MSKLSASPDFIEVIDDALDRKACDEIVEPSQARGVGYTGGGFAERVR